MMILISIINKIDHSYNQLLSLLNNIIKIRRLINKIGRVMWYVLIII